MPKASAIVARACFQPLMPFTFSMTPSINASTLSAAFTNVGNFSFIALGNFSMIILKKLLMGLVILLIMFLLIAPTNAPILSGFVNISLTDFPNNKASSFSFLRPSKKPSRSICSCRILASKPTLNGYDSWRGICIPRTSVIYLGSFKTSFCDESIIYSLSRFICELELLSTLRHQELRCHFFYMLLSEEKLPSCYF